MTRTLQDLSAFREEPLLDTEKARLILPEHLDWVWCVDPSLNNTGIVSLARDPEGETFLGAATLRPPDSESTGLAQTYDHSFWLEGAMHDLVKAKVDEAGHRGLILFEAPPAKGRFRSESAILAGHIVRSAGMDKGVPVEMVGRQRVYAASYGQANAKKVQAHAWLTSTYHPSYFEQVTNEHLRDAMLIAVYLCNRGRVE